MNVEAFINQQVRLSHLPNLLFVGAKLRIFLEPAIVKALIFRKNLINYKIKEVNLLKIDYLKVLCLKVSNFGE